MKPETLDEFKAQFDLASDNVRKNCKIITPGEINQDYMLHIAMKKTLSFIPYFSRIAASKEDNTIPRIYVAPTLHGCVVGAAVINETLKYSEPQDGTNKKLKEVSNLPGRVYLGGWYIHKIPFDVCLKPNKNLVLAMDIEYTEEHWLITFNKETRSYSAIIAGTFVPIELKIEPVVGKLPKETVVCLVEITDQEGVNLDHKTILKEGYYEIHFTSQYDKFSVSKVEKSTQGAFNEQKKLKASMLSLVDKPEFTNW